MAGPSKNPLAELVGAAPPNPIVPDETPEGLEWAERKSGFRCGGCGERITNGWEFVRLQVLRVAVSGERQVMKSTAYACARKDCGHVLELAEKAVAVRPIKPSWQYLDDPRIRELFGRLAPGKEAA